MDSTRTRSLLLGILAALLLLLSAAPAAAAPTVRAPVTHTPEELTLVRLINDYREKHGLARLLLSDLCTDASKKHGSDMAKYDFTGHVTVRSDWFPAGSTFVARLAACGYSSSSAGEICGYGSSYLAEEVFEDWCGSPVHDEEILDPHYKVLGVGLATGGSYGHYWTVDFGSYVDVTAHDASAQPPSFLDVPASNPYYQAIEAMAMAGFIDGFPVTGGREFRPDDAVNRAQFAKMIAGALQLQVDEDLTSPFTDLGADISDDLYPHQFVAAAFAKGIIKGETATTFAPWDGVKRVEAVTMVVRAAQNLDPGTLDTPPEGYRNTWGVSYDAEEGPLARIAEYNGLLAGLPLTTTAGDPWAAMPRGEVAQVLWNVMRRLGLS